MASEETQESLTRGYYQKPHQLRTECVDLDGTTYKLVDFIADLTFGWGSRWVILSHDEIIAGKRRANGEHMADLRSGLKDKKTIKKAVDDALAHELIEVLYTHLGTAYAIHRRFWGLAGFLPKWALFGRVPYDASSDPIPEIPAGGLNPPERESEAQKFLQSGGLNPPSGGIEATRPVDGTHQTVVLKQPSQSPQPAQEAARREPINTSLYTSGINTKDRYVAPSAPASIENQEEEHEDERQGAAATSSGPSVPLQASATLGTEERLPTEEEKAARAAELEKAEKQRREAWEQQRKEHQERVKVQVKLVQEETEIRRQLKKAEPGSAAAQQLVERQREILDELDRYRREEQ